MAELLFVGEVGRKETIDRRTQPAEPRWYEEVANAVLRHFDRSGRRRVDLGGNAGTPPGRAEADEGHFVMALIQRSRQGAGLRLGSADAREQLFRDDDAHGLASLGERLADVRVRVRERSSICVLDVRDHEVPIPALA